MRRKGAIMFEVKESYLKGAYFIKANRSYDSRGSFFKVYEKQRFLEAGLDFSLSETFFSVSHKNVLRGMHFQMNNPQIKLVSVLVGRVKDVIVDLRKDSETYGKWDMVELSGDNGVSLFIPRGFAHGFLTLEENSLMLYECDGAYDKESDTGIRFDDPDLAIDWRIDDPGKLVISDRDRNLMTFSEYKDRAEYGKDNRD